MRYLITGAGGFVGPWIVDHLLANDGEALVWGVDLKVSTELEARRGSRCTMGECNLLDPEAVRRSIDEARPEVVIHLAAASAVATSWSSPAQVLQTNTVCQLNLLEAIRSAGVAPVVLIASSAEVYGDVPQSEQPLGEHAPLRPISPYGVSKAMQDLLAFQYHAAHALHTIRLRLFHHTGPGRPDRFAVSSFARQVAEIEKGLREPTLHVGDLGVVRDISDVRDVARAWHLAALHGAPGAAYNVCSGRAVTLREVLGMLLASAEKEIEVVTDPARLRPADIPVLTGRADRLSADTEWTPLVRLEQTVSDLLCWWRDRV